MSRNEQLQQRRQRAAARLGLVILCCGLHGKVIRRLRCGRRRRVDQRVGAGT